VAKKKRKRRMYPVNLRGDEFFWCPYKERCRPLLVCRACQLKCSHRKGILEFWKGYERAANKGTLEKFMSQFEEKDSEKRDDRKEERNREVSRLQQKRWDTLHGISRPREEVETRKLSTSNASRQRRVNRKGTKARKTRTKRKGN